MRTQRAGCLADNAVAEEAVFARVVDDEVRVRAVFALVDTRRADLVGYDDRLAHGRRGRHCWWWLWRGVWFGWRLRIGGAGLVVWFGSFALLVWSTLPRPQARFYTSASTSWCEWCCVHADEVRTAVSRCRRYCRCTYGR